MSFVPAGLNRKFESVQQGIAEFMFLPFVLCGFGLFLSSALGQLPLLSGVSLAAAENSPLTSELNAAVKKVADASGYNWQTTVRTEGAGPFSGTTITKGRLANGGSLWVSTVSPQSTTEFVRRNDKTAVLVDGSWMTLDQAAARQPQRRGFGGFGGGLSGTVANFKTPLAQAEEVLKNAANLKKSNESIVAELKPEFVNDQLSAGSGGRGPGPGGNRGAGLRAVRGTATCTLKDGALAQLAVETSGVRETPNNAENIVRISTTVFSDVATTKASLPADAEEIVEALAAGRTPRVFVPEPGFKNLFNGKDLTGWSGRPNHWTVEEGAITGRTTKDNPAKGNTFLIAKSGDKNLVVDDFELRLSYRIVADNAAGFANSGIQYRSKDVGDFVVGGYQADFEAGKTYSGILYDERGGAGGRGIMAARGELVTWNSSGQKVVHGTLGKSDDIQAKIKSNDWNEYVVIAQGNRLQHFINGVQTIGVDDETENKRLSAGVLALQLHAGEPMTVQFKDIRIKSLRSVDLVGGANITVAKDFQIELLYNVPREIEGSWVAMCLDPKGRLYACDQNGALHRVSLPSARGGAVTPEKIDLDIGGAHGLLWAFDSLYVAVNEGNRPHGVYRLKDTNGDDKLDKVEMLRQVQASGEHGLHSLVPSPDGKSIYVVIGNRSSLTEMASSRVPYNWSEDQLLPRLPTGFMDDSHAPQGYISRMDPDGKNWELISVGLRNEFDVAFNKVGELFTYDADMEWDIGDPWYRPTRVNHVISGAEFGFRNGDAKWPAHYLDSFGEVVNVGPGSPTGITFGYGTKFPAKYQDALYLADWSFGKIRAVHLTPSGASYTGEVEDFISGQPFPVTDFIVNPNDGSMLVAVGGRGAQSALFRVTYAGKEATTPNPPDTRLQAQRDLRHRLETFHGKKDPAAVDTVWSYLSDQDRAIRYAARIALEWQDPKLWQDKALSEKDPRKAIASILSLARLHGKDDIHRKTSDPASDTALRGRMLAALDGISWSSLGHADRLDLLRTYCLIFIRMGKPEADVRQRLANRLDPHFSSKRPDLDALLARLLIYLEAPNAASKVVAAISVAPTQEEQVDLAVALRSLKTGWTVPLREQYFRWFNLAENYRGGNTFASSLRRAKGDAVATLSESDREQLKPILEAVVERKSPRDLLASRPFVKKWKLAELKSIADDGLKGGRSFERGRQLYSAVACSACHRFANEGGSMGPELTGVVGRYNVKDLLESIVDPSKIISDQYQAITITTNDGKIITGRVGNLSGSDVNVIEDMFDPGRMTNVRRADIESIVASKVSMMPEGLMNSLNADEVKDLVAYLLSRGDSEHAVYR